ncbi:MAG: hypothetical protein QOH68_4062, partial [Nocardioidaceae bacterium]|nr:hypothetical protein [Nocardioidaceae bacterium]
LVAIGWLSVVWLLGGAIANRVITVTTRDS